MSFLHPLELSRSVLDPIHGLVRLTEEEVKVINHVVYQRLRKVKQNGLLHLVFPSATHTRFEHSIGVLFVADSMLRALVFNSIASRDKQTRVASFDEAEPGQAIDFSNAPPERLSELFRITRLAALVHDLGHGPLSHTFDRFAPKRDVVLDLLGDPYLESVREFRGVFERYDSKQVRVPHEVMSCLFFARIWRDVDREQRSPWIPKAVTAAILGKDAFEIIDAPFNAWVTLAHDLVSSAPADSDRMDYLERDSKSCGVTYGLFDRNRLLKSMLCYRGSPGESCYRLGLKLSGYRAVENFVQARFELFVQVYYHKTNRAIEAMLNEIAQLAGDATVVRADSLPDLVEDYIRLSDEYFLDALRGESVGGRTLVSEPRIRELASLIHERRLWKRVFDLQDYGGAEGEEQDESQENKVLNGIKKLDELFSKLETESGERALYLDKVEPKATKDLAEGAAILVARDGIYTASPKPDWEARSPLIKALGTGEKMVARIFAKDTGRLEVKDYRNLVRKYWGV